LLKGKSGFPCLTPSSVPSIFEEVRGAVFASTKGKLLYPLRGMVVLWVIWRGGATVFEEVRGVVFSLTKGKLSYPQR
jgi:hypothetical protein